MVTWIIHTSLDAVKYDLNYEMKMILFRDAVGGALMAKGNSKWGTHPHEVGGDPPNTPQLMVSYPSLVSLFLISCHKCNFIDQSMGPCIFNLRPHQT